VPVNCLNALPHLRKIARVTTKIEAHDSVARYPFRERPMPTFNLPLSGDVVQSINPFTAFFSPSGGQFGLININLGQSGEPAVEQDMLSDVGSYGRQLGRIGDALVVLLAHFHPRQPLTPDETAAIDALKEMLNKVADVKEKSWPRGAAALTRIAHRLVAMRRRRFRIDFAAVRRASEQSVGGDVENAERQ
jgi:hypothetical protein